MNNTNFINISIIRNVYKNLIFWSFFIILIFNINANACEKNANIITKYNKTLEMLNPIKLYKNQNLVKNKSSLNINTKSYKVCSLKVAMVCQSCYKRNKCVLCGNQATKYVAMVCQSCYKRNKCVLCGNYASKVAMLCQGCWFKYKRKCILCGH